MCLVPTAELYAQCLTVEVRQLTFPRHSRNSICLSELVFSCIFGELTARWLRISVAYMGYSSKNELVSAKMHNN